MADLITERQQFESSLLNLLSNITAGGSGEIPAAMLTLIDLVKAKLDEIIPAVSLSLDEDEGIEDPYSLLINSFLDESAKRVLLSARLMCSFQRRAQSKPRRMLRTIKSVISFSG
jgi:hypothetical protein